MTPLKAIRITTLGWVLVGALALVGLVVSAASFSTVSNISAVQSTWNEFEQGRSEKAQVLNALRREIGYGGMIHRFKNFVLRKDVALATRVDEHLGGAMAAITHYRSLGVNEAEQQALADIQAMLAGYGYANRTTRRLIADGRSTAEIDRVVRVDDGPALAGLDTLSREVSAQTRTQTEELTKAELVNALGKALGYGGAVHHFKNFVLRHEHDIIPLMELDIQVAQDTLDTYTFHALSLAEVTALEDIRQVIEQYGTALNTVENLHEQGNSPEQIDRTVRVDDGPALTGLVTLSREIAVQNTVEANRVAESLDYVSTLTRSVAWGTSVLIGLLVLMALWGLRFQISLPLNRLTHIMTRLSRGDLSIAIPPMDASTEIGEMARSVQVFKDNAIERERAEKALKESEIRHRTVLASVVDALITISDHGMIESFNPAAERMFGYEADQVIGKNISMLMPEPYSSEHDGYLEKYRNTGEEHILGVSGRELTARRQDGSEFPIELAVTEMYLGKKRLFTGIVRDITERRKIDRMKNEFISTVSHELRTPLTSIRGALGLLVGGAMGDMPKPTRNLLTIAHGNTERLLLLINDILDIEKIEAGKMLFQFANVQLMPFLEEVVTANQAYAEEYGVQIKIVRGVEGGQVFADARRLTQVMSNLLSNACKFSPRGKTVEVAVDRKNSDLRISVSDIGPGIPESFQPNVFSKFTQSDATDTRKQGGTGLGLSITRAIVEKHGGRIGFVSTEGAGATFHVDLPAAVSGMDEMEAETAPMQINEGQDTILIVEDDPDMASLLGRMLAENGFNTDIVYTGAEARKRLQVTPSPYSAVTLDLTLPDQDGLSIYRELRDRPTTSDLPVIVVSGQADESKNKLNGGSVGVAEWLQKPFDGDQLVAAVKTAIASISRPKVLHVEDDLDLAKVVSALLADVTEVVNAPTLKAAKKLLNTHNFNLVLLDVELPDGSGLDLLELIRSNVVPPQVVIFSGQDVEDKIAGQVAATLTKSSTGNDELLSTIRALVRK